MVIRPSIVDRVRCHCCPEIDMALGTGRAAGVATGKRWTVTVRFIAISVRSTVMRSVHETA